MYYLINCKNGNVTRKKSISALKGNLGTHMRKAIGKMKKNETTIMSGNIWNKSQYQGDKNEFMKLENLGRMLNISGVEIPVGMKRDFCLLTKIKKGKNYHRFWVDVELYNQY